MIRFFTNRELSAKLDVNLSRWKRWSREFLPPDPLGGLQSGFARQYSADQAFAVFLGGHLVADLHFSIPEARRILADIRPCFETLGLLHDFNRGKTRASAAAEGPAAIHIRIWRLPASQSQPVRFGYLLRQLLASRRVAAEDGQVQEERLRQTPLGETASMSSADDQLSWRTLNIGVVHRRFLERISAAPA